MGASTNRTSEEPKMIFPVGFSAVTMSAIVQPITNTARGMAPMPIMESATRGGPVT